MPATRIDYADGTFEIVPDGRPLEDQKAAKLADLADRRWRAQVAMTYSGRPTATDDTASTRLTTVIAALTDIGSTGPVSWKFSDGQFVSMALAELKAMRGAGVAHVQSCFINEATIAAAISAADTAEELDAISIEAGWP